MAHRGGAEIAEILSRLLRVLGVSAVIFALAIPKSAIELTADAARATLSARQPPPMSTETKQMQCMEVWGGNRYVDSGVVMAGLDAWLYSRPCPGGHDEAAANDDDEALGGDVHYVSSCAAGLITRILIADVAGHGRTVAHAANRLRTYMRRYINSHDQGKLVRAVNREFATLAGGSGRFATALVFTFEAPNGELLLCNAGHPTPLIRRRATGRWEALVPDRHERERAASTEPVNVPFGIDEEMTYCQEASRLAVGDQVLCYTDGLIESRGRDGQMLGTEGLLGILQHLDASDPSRVLPDLLATVEAQHPGNLTEDDVTLLLFRPNGLYPSVPLKDRLLAPLRLIKAVVGSYMPWQKA